MKRGVAYLVTVGIGALTLASWAKAQSGGSVTQKGTEDAAPEAITTSNEIVVLGEIRYRNRTDDAEPVLSYGSEYFQRFEPLTAGDALKRVPGVTFLSDVIESDGARLRGLDPGYTQILINGEKVPGSNVDRSFFLDRIPAELIERVEIVRSSSARRTGDAVAGSLNIVLRNGYQLDGGYGRVGGLLFDDGKVKPSFGLVWGGAVGPGRLLIGGNIQGRYNPKKKQSFRYGDSPENNPNFKIDDFDNREDQDDVRDGTDYALNATYGIDGETTDLEIGGFFVRTDRTEDERSFEYDDPVAKTGPVRAATPGNLLTDNANVKDIDQVNYSLAGKVKHRWSLGETSLKLGYARFKDESHETEYEVDFDRSTPRFTGDLEDNDIVDSEFSAGIEHGFDLSTGIKLVVGGFYQDKDRDTELASTRNRFNLTAAARIYDQFDDNPTRFATDFDPADADIAASNIEEQRHDVFALVEGKSGAIDWEAGLRYETTRTRIDTLKTDYQHLLPSVSAKIALSPRDRILLSAARTVRRPQFDFITSVLLEAELGDNDLLGNPDLKPERSWGIDAGYERRIGRTGVAGINFFYRRITDLVEMTNTGVEGSEGEGTFVLQPRNVGKGKAWGVEFDLSTSLAIFGLPDTGIFGNLALLDSEIDDFIGKRRFNGQSKYVFNVGFIQDVKSFDAAFGASFRKQGPAIDRIVGEEIRTTYGGDLEVFVEKRFGNWLTVRAVGSNLLDGSKDEVFNKFNTIEDQFDRSFDEYELESEKAGPVLQLVARIAY